MGEWPVWADFNKTNEEALHKAELLSGVPTLIMLFIAFGAMIAAGVPLILALAVTGPRVAADETVVISKSFDPMGFLKPVPVNITGIGGEPWIAAAEALSKTLGLPIRTVKIGPRCAIEDHGGDWARASEIRDAGCLLVRPDQHVAWRAATLTADPQADLSRVLRAILGH